LPPLACLADYLELLSAVEAAAAELGVRVVLDGTRRHSAIRG